METIGVIVLVVFIAVFIGRLYYRKKNSPTSGTVTGSGRDDRTRGTRRKG